METRSNKTTQRDKNNILPSFSNKEDMILLLKALFKYGYSELSPILLPDMSKEACYFAIQSAFERVKIPTNKKPSIIDWLNSGIFDKDECNIPLALLFISLYEQPLSKQENQECDFREIYFFLYKMTTNQIAPHLSHNSAKVLHKLLSELIDKVWPSMQPELLEYLTNIHIYSRSEVRRTYSRKRSSPKRKAAKNCLS